MLKRSQLILAIVAVSFFCSCAVAKMLHEQNEGQKTHSPEDYGFVRSQHVRNDIVYAPGLRGEKRLRLDVHWNDSKTPQPIAFVIHGGGWFMGSKDQAFQDRVSDLIANHGYVVFNLDYRMIPKYTVVDCIQDTFGAIVWAKKHAKEFGGDPMRAGATGFSAGGHLSGMVATAGDRMDVFPPTGQKGAEYNASVKVAVPFYGVYDLLTAPRDVFPVPMFLNRLFYRYVFIGNPDKNKEIGRKISPITYISDHTPPQLVVCGDADSLKLYPQSIEYVEALKKAGRTVEFITVKGADHAFNGQYWTPESQNAHKAMLDFFDKYLK